MSTTLYHNGTVITLDNENSIGTCLLIKDNKILGIYSSPDECKSANTDRMVDLQGKTVIPGFNDNHIHLKDRTILGEDRAKRAYPYRSLLDGGVRLSFGSDAPGEKSFNPFVGIHYAVNREDEKISLIEALKCYTSGNAYAEFKEHAKGCLSPGMAADFLVLSENPLTMDERDINRDFPDEICRAC